MVTLDQKGNIFILLFDGMTLFDLIHTIEFGSIVAGKKYVHFQLQPTELNNLTNLITSSSVS